MSFWKTMTGAGIGMVIGGPVGAIAGGLGAHVATKKIEEAKKEGKAEALKKAAEQRMQEHKKDIKNASNFEELLKLEMDFLDSEKEKHQLIIALFAVGMGAANADGKIASEEQIEIDKFLNDVEKLNLTDKEKKQIERFKSVPPDAEEVIEEIKKLSSPNYRVFIEAANQMINLDDIIADEEVEFVKRINNISR